MVESILIICDQPPIGTNSAIEAIRFSSGLGAIDDDIKRNLILMGDAILVLKSDFRPEIMATQSFSNLKMMAEISNLTISILKEDLEEFGLEKEDLVNYEHLEILNKEALADLLIKTDASFKF